MEREVILSDLPVDIVAIFVSRSWEPLLVGLSPPPPLLVQEFYANIHDVDGSSFKVFLRGHSFRVTPSADLSLYSTCFYSGRCPCSVDSFEHPACWGPTIMATGSLPTDRQVLLRIVCTNLWPVTHTSSLPMVSARFLYALLHGDSIDLPSFVCQQILASFRTPGGRIGLPYACLIHKVVLSLGASFPEGSSTRIGHPIGQQTIYQSRSHVPSSSSSAHAAAQAEPIDVFDFSEPFDPITDILTGGSCVFLPPRSDFPSTFTSAPGWLPCLLTPW